MPPLSPKSPIPSICQTAGGVGSVATVAVFPFISQTVGVPLLACHKMSDGLAPKLPVPISRMLGGGDGCEPLVQPIAFISVRSACDIALTTPGLLLSSNASFPALGAQSPRSPPLPV